MATEQAYYNINTANIIDKSTLPAFVYPPDASFGYKNNNGEPPYNPNPSSNTTAVSQKLYKLNAANGGERLGLGITLKVMAGDKIDIMGKSYWKDYNTSGNNVNNNLTPPSIISGLLNTANNGTHSGENYVLQNQINQYQLSYFALLYGFLQYSSGRSPYNANTQKPKAFINYIVFDEQYNYVTGNSSAVGLANTVKNHYDVDAILRAITVPKNGYIYILFSNESPVDVFFDNLQVTHTKGPLVEETHYYPFGLTMSGISSKAAGGLENRYKFNDGTELNTDLGVNFYETDYRSYNPQIGRFCQIDALGEIDYYISPIVYACNNPILINDPLGLTSDTTNKKENFVDQNGNIKVDQIQEVVVGGEKKNSSVGQPGTWESIIPVWGSGRAAIDDFQNGKWGWGLFNTALAVTDVFLVKSLVTGAGKIIAKTIYKTAVEEIVKSNTQRITLATIRSMTRETLMEQVTNPKLKSVIDNLYRPGAKIGSGSTADMIRIVGDAGHVEKGGTRITGLANLINSGQLSGHDLDIAVQLRDDLIHALSTVK